MDVACHPGDGEWRDPLLRSAGAWGPQRLALPAGPACFAFTGRSPHSSTGLLSPLPTPALPHSETRLEPISPGPSVSPSDKRLTPASKPPPRLSFPEALAGPSCALPLGGVSWESLLWVQAGRITCVSPDVHVHGQSVAGFWGRQRVALALQCHVALGAPHGGWVDGGHFSFLQLGDTALILRATASPTDGVWGHHGLHQS